MDEDEMQDALELLRSGALRGQRVDVTDEQMLTLKAAIEDLEELREAALRGPVAAPAITNGFFVRG